MKRVALALALLVVVLVAHLSAVTCGDLTSAVFCETFDSATSPQGRGGDLNPARWMTSRLVPDGISGVSVDMTRLATIPTCRSGVGAGDVYSPNDLLICDGTSSWPGKLQSAITSQYYGVVDSMIVQPFDFAGRTGKVDFDADAWSQGALGTYVNLNITEEPTPANGFHIFGNQESGPIPRNGVMIQWSGAGGEGDTGTTVGYVNVYADYVMTTLTPTFSVSGGSRPLVLPGSLNRIEVRLSTTNIQVWESDYFTSGAFPNFRKIYEATLSLPWSRGYVHLGIRNHSTAKFGFPLTSVYYWDNVGFDGPALAPFRQAEFPDNVTTGHVSMPPMGEDPYDFKNLGYQISDGSGRTQGLWNPTSLVSPLSSTSLNLTSATAAKLTLHFFVNTLSETPTTSTGFLYRFNGGTWRTRLFTSLEVNTLNGDAGCAGNIAMAVDLTLADLTSGVNTIDFNATGTSMGYPPTVANLGILVSAPETLPGAPSRLRFIRFGGLGQVLPWL